MIELDITVDRAGFPMVWAPSINAYLHWLPVTKIQIEYFLSSTNDTGYGEMWYNDLLGTNPRVSPGAVNGANYWQAIATGVLPADARRYAIWCGPSYAIPTAQEWYDAYEYFHNVKAEVAYMQRVAEYEKIKPRTKTLIEALEFGTAQEGFQLDDGRTLADQMLMRLGVMEYVFQNDQRNTFAGYGQTNTKFFGSLDRPRRGYPQPLNNPTEGARMKHYGFRLIRRK